MLFSRMDLLFDNKIPACTLFSGPYYFAEQLGFRKVTDCTFMMATMITGAPDPEDVRKFFRALKRAQRDIDLRPELYTRFYKNEFPKRYHDKMDTRRWGPGERIVFEPYSKEVFEESRDWIRERGIFEGNDLGNFGSNSVSGRDELTLALGARSVLGRSEYSWRIGRLAGVARASRAARAEPFLRGSRRSSRRWSRR